MKRWMILAIMMIGVILMSQGSLMAWSWNGVFSPTICGVHEFIGENTPNGGNITITEATVSVSAWCFTEGATPDCSGEPGTGKLGVGELSIEDLVSEVVNGQSGEVCIDLSRFTHGNHIVEADHICHANSGGGSSSVTKLEELASVHATAISGSWERVRNNGKVDFGNFTCTWLGGVSADCIADINVAFDCVNECFNWKGDSIDCN